MTTTTALPNLGAKGANPLKGLLEYGQSPWMDYVRRDLLTSGALKKLIQEDGLMGMTSNPTIFEKAITGSKDYSDILESPEAKKLDDSRRPSPAAKTTRTFSNRPKPKSSTPRVCTRRLPFATSRMPPTFSGPCTSKPNAATATSASKSPRCSPTTRKPPTAKPAASGKASAAKT